MRAILLITLGLMFVAGNVSRAAGPATTQAVDANQEMEKGWDDLQKEEPWSTRAILDFADKPAATIAFFKAHLQPLKIEQKDLDDALAALGSDDEKIWKPAFEKLEYFDPRLNVDLEVLMQNAQEPVGRNRLIEILSNYPAGELKDRSIALRNSGGGDFNFYESARQSSWWAEKKISRLDNAWNHKQKWARADRAIVLLQHIGSPEAIEVLKNMSKGNPNAQPTKIAKAALESLGTK